MNEKRNDSGRSNLEYTVMALWLRDAQEQKLGSHERRRALQNKYSWLHPTDITIGLMAFGFECGDGWLFLLEELFARIDEIVNREKLANFRVIQVKEKYGSLRVYTECGNDEIDELIDDAEEVSLKICEICGKPGELRDDDSWLSTLCEPCKKRTRGENKEK